MRSFLLLLALSTAFSCRAQQRDMVYYKTNGKVDGYRLALMPKTDTKGLIVFIPGLATEPDDMMKETELPQKAVDAGYTVVITYLSNHVYFDSACVLQTRLEQVVSDAMKKYKVPTGKLIIGGHSIGGHQAMVYAEKALMPGATAVQPAAVFGIDPPLDMKHLYNASRRTDTKSLDAAYIITSFNALYGGPPEKFPAVYEAASSFYRDVPDGGNAKYLVKIPVHLYCDPDVNWFINERNTPVEWTNLADLSACIVTLRTLGNQQAQLVTNLGKGYRPDGSRHPHALSQVQTPEFLNWVKQILK